MAYLGKVLKYVGIALLFNSSACAAPGTISGGDMWPTLNYNQDENKLPVIKPKPEPAIGNGDEISAKPVTGITALIEELVKEKSQWQANMGAQKTIYLNAKEKALLAMPDKSRGAWMTAQLQLSRLSQVGDDLSDFIKKVDALSEKSKDPALNDFRKSLGGLRNTLIAFLAKELAFLEKTNPND